MKTTFLAIGLSLAGSPILAGSLAFEPVAPEGLDAAAAAMVASLQAVMPDQMAAFEAQGFGHFGALAVPQGVALNAELLSSVANFATADEARAAVLETCAAQTGSPCTVIGLLVPGS